MAGVMRDAQSVEFQNPGSVDVNQAAGGFVAPRYGKYAGTQGRIATSSNEQTSALSQIAAGLAPALVKYGEQKIDTMNQEAYLAGQAAAASGKAQDEMDTNPFTKNWQNAGFADTKGRLGVADAVAQTAVDIKEKYKEVPPDQFQAYLAQRRDKLMALQNGMSLEARKSMMVQMATADQTAISQHAEAYRKYAIDAQMQAINTSGSVALDALNASKGDPVAYENASVNAVANIATNVAMNPNLDDATKSKAITQFAGLMLANNNERAYELMRDQKGPDGKTMLDRVSWDDQTSLAKAYSSSRKDTEAMRTSQYQTNLGLYQAKLNDPLSDPVSWEQHQAIVQQGVQLGVMSADKVASMAKDWADANAKKQKNLNIASAWASGDIQTMYQNNATDQEGAEAYIAMQARRGVPVATAVTNLAQVGLTTGSAAAFATVGRMMRSSVTSIGASGTIDPSQLSGLNAVFDTIQQAEKKGNTGAKTAFLSSFDDGTQAKLLDYWDGLKQGKSPDVAAADAATNAQQNDALTPAAKAALASGHAQENTDLVNAITPKGLFGQIWDKVVPDVFRSKNNVAADKIRASNSQGILSWKDDPETVENAQAAGKVALMQELDDITRTRPNMSKDARETMALTNVANRVVDTMGGPVIMPKGQTLQSFFGVQPSVNAEIVGSALTNMHRAGDGQRTVYSVTAGGQMKWQVYGKDGVLVNPGGTFDPKDVAAVATAEQDKLSAAAMKTDGAGVTHTGNDGASVNYNGNNTIGLGTASALQVRDDLFKYEGLRNTPYDDASGKVVNGKKVQTVGVGVSTTSDFYPKVQANGQVTNADISDSFMRASDRAMRQANTEQVKLPGRMQQNSSTLRLFSQLAYQGGSIPNDLVKAMQAGDRAGAMQALTDSPQYKMAHPERRVFYTNLMQGIMPVQ